MNTPTFSLHQNAAADDGSAVSYFGITDTRGKHVPFGIKQEDRSRHSYVIGKTGMGKSTLLENLAVQDIKEGRGLCFIDPHGSTAEKLMEYIPEDRVKDVLYFAPFDMQYPISFNVLEDVDADKRHFVVAGLMSTFEKIWVDAWSARMAYILQNTLAALLEFPGATLLGVNRMYIDKEYRKNVIAHVTDPATRSFWVDEYSKYTDRYAQEATPAIQNKIGQFAANALVRNIIGQEQSAFDIRHLMDTRKIFIANLSKGRMGEGNANLLGSMLITKIYLSAMSRADAPPSVMRELPPFYLFVDEFQNFANKSFADILSEARKYKLALTVAHQYIEQMEDEVRAAVFGNVGTMMTFRVGSYDAEVLEKEFAPIFTADDLVNLGRFQLYLKLMIDGVSSHPFSAATMAPIPEPEVSHRDRAIAFSRAQYSRPRAEVEKDIADWTARKYEDPEAEEKEKARLERRAAREAEENRPPRERMQGAPKREESGRPPRPRERDNRRESGNGAQRGERPAPRERRSDDAPRAEAPKKSAAPVPRAQPAEAPNKDLKQFLSALKQQETPTPPKVAAEPTQEARRSAPPTTAEGGARPAQQAPHDRQKPRKDTPQEAHAAHPSADDGKGISPEGREELRNLLSKLRDSSATGGESAPRVTQRTVREGAGQAVRGEGDGAGSARNPAPKAAPKGTQRAQEGKRASETQASRPPRSQQQPIEAATAAKPRAAAQPQAAHETHVPIVEAGAAPAAGAETPRREHATHVPIEDATPHEAVQGEKAHTTHVPISDATPKGGAAGAPPHTTHIPVADATPHSANGGAAHGGQSTHVPIEDATPHAARNAKPPHKEHTTHVHVEDATPHGVPVGQAGQQQGTQSGAPTAHAGANAPGIPVEELRRRLKVEKPNLDR